jgi:hypothetical protein
MYFLFLFLPVNFYVVTIVDWLDEACILAIYFCDDCAPVACIQVKGDPVEHIHKNEGVLAGKMNVFAVDQDGDAFGLELRR